MQNSMEIAANKVYIAIVHENARLISKEINPNPLKALLLEFLAYIIFKESISLQIRLKLG